THCTTRHPPPLALHVDHPQPTLRLSSSLPSARSPLPLHVLEQPPRLGALRGSSSLLQRYGDAALRNPRCRARAPVSSAHADRCRGGGRGSWAVVDAGRFRQLVKRRHRALRRAAARADPRRGDAQQRDPDRRASPAPGTPPPQRTGRLAHRAAHVLLRAGAPPRRLIILRRRDVAQAAPPRVGRAPGRDAERRRHALPHRMPPRAEAAQFGDAQDALCLLRGW
ncbi:hypothetical protein T484DRAFT_3647718, partial [Baffinella frigidus]